MLIARSSDYSSDLFVRVILIPKGRRLVASFIRFLVGADEFTAVYLALIRSLARISKLTSLEQASIGGIYFRKNSANVYYRVIL